MEERDGSRQLTVYSNSVETPAENLMILPVPWPDTVRFEAEFMKAYPRFLEDCEASLQRPPVRGLLSAARSASFEPKSMLPVLDIGSYRVSVVPSVGDFSRLNGAVFSLPSELKGMLAASYGGKDVPIGFICCKLRAGNQQYEPLAYSHRRWKWDSLFVPTKHFHAHASARDLYGHTYFGEVLTASASDALEKEPHWEHCIYSVNTKVPAAHRSDALPRETNFIQSEKLPAGYWMSPRTPIHCWERVGQWSNIDLEFPLDVSFSSLTEEHFFQKRRHVSGTT